MVAPAIKVIVVTSFPNALPRRVPVKAPPDIQLPANLISLKSTSDNVATAFAVIVLWFPTAPDVNIILLIAVLAAPIVKVPLTVIFEFTNTPIRPSTGVVNVKLLNDPPVVVIVWTPRAVLLNVVVPPKVELNNVSVWDAPANVVLPFTVWFALNVTTVLVELLKLKSLNVFMPDIAFVPAPPVKSTLYQVKPPPANAGEAADKIIVDVPALNVRPVVVLKLRPVPVEDIVIVDDPKVMDLVAVDVARKILHVIL